MKLVLDLSLQVERPGPWPDDPQLIVDALRVYAAVVDLVGHPPTDITGMGRDARTARRAREVADAFEGSVAELLASNVPKHRKR